MREAYSSGSDAAARFEHCNAVARRAADWLGLAAAPTFAVMALLTVGLGGGARDVICSAMRGAPPLSGMVPMYVLMSAVHLAPWLRLIPGRRGGAPRP